MTYQSEAASCAQTMPAAGCFILNADDWGRDRETTRHILDCAIRGSLSSTSAMVFMEDSERAAALAREHRLDIGLHLNLTTPFSAPQCPRQIVEAQRKVAACLRRHRLSPALFHPLLTNAFEYLVLTQLEEYRRLYGALPTRIDGHHHMHLCTNVLVANLLPPDTIVRRSFSFIRGEKSWGNRFYRRTVDRVIARRHRLTDFFFSLPPLEPHRLERIVALSRRRTVEVETHPVNPEEYQFLIGGGLIRLLADARIAVGFIF